MLKQQSAVEFLATYSWAILIIALFIAVVAVLALSRPPAAYLASTCNIQPSLPCTGTLLTYNTIAPLHFTMLFTNQLGTTMYFPFNGFNATTTNIGVQGVSYNIGNCTPQLATSGTQVICTANIPGSLKPPVGTQTTTTFQIKYQLCNGNTYSTCLSTVYISTGTSLQTLAPSSAALYQITFNDIPTTGSIALNGAVYPYSYNSFFVSGTYNAFALPPQGYAFSSWSITGSSTLTSTTTQSTVLTLNANAVLTATYTAVTTTTTVTLSTTIAYSYVQSKSNYCSSVTSCAQAFTNSVTSGDLIFVSGIQTGAGTPSVTDSQGNSFTQDASDTATVSFWHAAAKSTGSDTVTYSEGDGNEGLGLTILEISGASSAIVTNSVNNCNPCTSSALTSGLSYSSGSFLIGGVYDNIGSSSGWTTTSGFSSNSEPFPANYILTEWEIPSTPGSSTFSISGGNSGGIDEGAAVYHS